MVYLGQGLELASMRLSPWRGSCGRVLEIQTVGNGMKAVVGLQPKSSRQRFLVMAKGEGCNVLLGSRASTGLDETVAVAVGSVEESLKSKL
jgi:hypothetical protein